jgi:hypothetical protein
MEPLAELRPEAEPPLPAAHEMLRSRTPAFGTAKRDPTPARRDPTPARRDPTPARAKDPPPRGGTALGDSGPRAVIAAVVESPLAAAPGPIVDPSAWFEESSVGGPSPLPPAPTRARAPTPARAFMTPTPDRPASPDAAQAMVDADERRRQTDADAPTRDEGRPRGIALIAEVAELSGPLRDDSASAPPVRNDTVRSPVRNESSRTAALRELDRERATQRGHVRAVTVSREIVSADEAGAVAVVEKDRLLAVPDAMPSMPSLVETSRFRRAAIAVFVCIVVGTLVGWLISNPAPPTPDETRSAAKRGT